MDTDYHDDLMHETDEVRYTEGDCNQLAQAIHEATGWLVSAILDECNCGHVFVTMPDGHVLDVCGVSTLGEMQYTWEDSHTRVEHFKDAHELTSLYGWPIPTPDQHTKRVAAKLLTNL